MANWAESRFTGLFSLHVQVPLRPYDPQVAITAAEMPAWCQGGMELGCSGAGWLQSEADAACLGEGIERLLAQPLPRDHSIEESYSCWSAHEPATAPRDWGLYHPDQYAANGFPLCPLTLETKCRWVCCRESVTGNAVWVPDELVYLVPRAGEHQQYTFGFSTGLSCAPTADQALLRGTQEVIERDALMGAWWGRYPISEIEDQQVRELIGEDRWQRLDRRNLTYRFFHLDSPFSQHVTLVSLAGEDEEGWIFSVGSACRETRVDSWLKSLLEAVQGRHCVRRLLSNWQEDGQPSLNIPTTFFEHALYYTLHRDHLNETILEGAPSADDHLCNDRGETLRDLQANLGPQRPILFRNLTPPGIAEQFNNWIVLRVLIPQMQALHGDHRMPFLGGPLWDRPISKWQDIPPHPFA